MILRRKLEPQRVN